MSTSSKTIDLAGYREKTAEQRRYEKEGFHKIVDYLPIHSLEYEDRLLVVKYDFTRQPELARRIKRNPAWGFLLFGVISDIFIEDLIITMNVLEKSRSTDPSLSRSLF